MKKPQLDKLPGDELAKRGYRTVAKISLWISQRESIDKLFHWSERCDLMWRWFETKYDESLSELSTQEVSFVFFLTEEHAKIIFLCSFRQIF